MMYFPTEAARWTFIGIVLFYGILGGYIMLREYIKLCKSIREHERDLL